MCLLVHENAIHTVCIIDLMLVRGLTALEIGCCKVGTAE